MQKQQFSSYRPSANGKRSLEEAVSEIQREMDVRKRLFDRWVSEGKMSWVDAHDRLERHMSALTHMLAYMKLLDQQEAEEMPSPSTPVSFIPANSLDEPTEAAAA